MEIIYTHLEGGLGDITLGCRFIPAIKERHVNCKIIGLFNTCGATFQKEAIETIYPSFFNEIIILNESDRKSKDFPYHLPYYGITENYPASILNLKDDVFKYGEGVVYDCHPDSMKWTEDADFRARFAYQPKPEMKRYDTQDPFVVFQPFSQINGKNYCAPFYVRSIVNKVLSLGLKIKIILSPDNKIMLDGSIRNLSGVQIIEGAISEACKLFADYSCKAAVLLDSGYKHIAHAYGMPMIVFSCYSPAPHQVSPQQMVRWMPFEKNVFPLNYDLSYVLPIIEEIVKNPAAGIFPVKDFDKVFNLKFKGSPI